MKKRFIVLSSFISLLTLFLSNNSYIVETKADSYDVISTTAFSYLAGSNGSTDAHLVISLSDNDYGDTRTLSYSNLSNKIDSIDLSGFIKINGQEVNFDDYNEQGFKLGNELHLNTFEPNDGTFSVRINFNGKTTSDIQSITLLEGCQIPSEGYLDGTSNDIYQIKSELNSYPASCNYNWVTYMDTDAYLVKPAVGNTYLGICLTVNDYPDSFTDGTIGNNAFSNYSSYVTLDNDISINDGYGLFSYNSTLDSIWLRTNDNANLVDTVSIKKGTVLSSYHYVKNSPKWPLFFKCTTDRTFTRNSRGVFVPIFNEVAIDVEAMDFTSINNLWLSFKLSSSDYHTARQATFSNSAQYNFWENITVVDSSDVSHTLTDVCTGYNHIFNFNSINDNEFSVNLAEPYSNAGQIKKIIIPAGTEFPEYDYLAGNKVGQPSAFVTSEDIEYIYGSNRIFAKAIETKVTGMGYFVNTPGYLGFVLSNNDYPELGNTTGAFESYYANCHTVIDSSNIGLTFNNRYSLWSFGTLDDSISYQVNGTLKAGIVNISAGTLFPSYVFTNDTSTAPIVYEVSEDVSFLYDGSSFINITNPRPIENTINALETHGSGNDFGIDFVLENYDWPNDITNLDLINNATYGDKSYKSKYNTFDYVKAYDEDDNLLNFTSEIFVNVWGKTGVLSIRLVTPSTNMENLSYIVVDEGLELPTYGGFYVDEENDKYSDRSYYVINEHSVFLYDYDSSSFYKTNFIERDSSINGITEMEGENQNSLITFSLGNCDYENIDTSFNVVNDSRTLFNTLNFGDYITINGIKLSSFDNYSSTDIVLYENNRLSIRTLGNNTGYYYLDNTNRIYTSDLTKYEIRIAKGCQFPSYSFINGSPTYECYVITQDYSFIWLNGEYVNYGHQSSNDLDINKINYLNHNDTGYVYLTLDNSDWPIANVFSGDITDTISCPGFINHVEVIDVDGNVHTPSTDEVFINITNTGIQHPTVAFKVDILSAQNIKKVVFYEGCILPSYDCYLDNDSSWYLLNEKESYYSSKDNVFYLGSNLTEVEYAEEFNDAFIEICSGYDGVSDNSNALANKFYAFENIYNYELSNEVKNNINSSEDNEVIQMLETYIFVVNKYHLTNFLNYSPNLELAKNVVLFDSNNSASIILPVCMFTLFALSGVAYFKIRADKKDEKDK